MPPERSSIAATGKMMSTSPTQAQVCECGRATITVVDRSRLWRRRAPPPEMESLVDASTGKCLSIRSGQVITGNKKSTKPTATATLAATWPTKPKLKTRSKSKTKTRRRIATRLPFALLCSGGLLTTILLIDTIGSQLSDSLRARTSSSLITGALASELDSSGVPQTAIQSK